MPMRMARSMQTAIPGIATQMRPTRMLMGHAHSAETPNMASTSVATLLTRRKGGRFNASVRIVKFRLRMQPVNHALLAASAIGAAGERGGLQLREILRKPLSAKQMRRGRRPPRDMSARSTSVLPEPAIISCRDERPDIVC